MTTWKSNQPIMKCIKIGIEPKLTLTTLTLVVALLGARSVWAQGVVLPLPAEDQQTITAQLGPGRGRRRACPASRSRMPRLIFRFRSGTPTYQVTAGRNAGKYPDAGGDKDSSA